MQWAFEFFVDAIDVTVLVKISRSGTREEPDLEAEVVEINCAESLTPEQEMEAEDKAIQMAWKEFERKKRK